MDFLVLGGTSEIAQLAKCLLWKHEDLSSIPRTCVKASVGEHTCHLSARRGRGEGPRRLLAINLVEMVSSRISKSLCLKKLTG